MEQVLRTVSALNGAGFSGLCFVTPAAHSLLMIALDVTMYESLLRPHEVVAIPPLPSIADISDKLKAQELRKEEKRQGQIATSKARNLARGDGKRKRDAEDVDGTDTIIEEAEVADVLEAKRVKTDDVNGEDAMPESGAATPARAPEENVSASTSANPPEKVKRWRNVPMGEARTVVSRPFPEVRGHTSYLTFATLVPHPVGSSSIVSAAADTNDTQDAEGRTGDVIEVVDNTSQMQLGED
jgi:tRNA (adenine57-N1/adenine58-N1)-methyltransferase